MPRLHLFNPIPSMVNVIPVTTFPIPVLATGTCHLFPFSRISDFRLATLKWIAESKAWTDDGLASLVSITDMPFPIYDALQSFTYIVVSVVKLICCIMSCTVTTAQQQYDTQINDTLVYDAGCFHLIICFCYCLQLSCDSWIYQSPLIRLYRVVSL